jgi:glycosyltransferase involved in cell wall biosynthesis
MKPKVSIILPYFNSADTFSDAIESMLCQTFEDFELLLIDNNSTDTSFDIASDYASRDSRIRLIEISPGDNLAKNYNNGIAVSGSPYLAIMDARDVSFPNRLQKQISYLEQNKSIGLVSSQIRNSTKIDLPEEEDRVYQYINWVNRIITHEDIAANRFIETPFLLSNSVFRREIVDRFGGFAQGDFPTEFELTLRWIHQGILMYKTPEVLYDWNYSASRFSHTEDRYFDQGLFETKSLYIHKWLVENNRFYPDVVVWGAGKSSRHRFYVLHELGVNAKFYIDLRANPEHKVIQYLHTPPAGHSFIICYVANRAAREKIRVFLVELGYIEGVDYIFVA